MIDERVSDHLKGLEGIYGSRNQAVLYGAETHICIRQTCLDLLERNFTVFIVVDATTSMTPYDRNVGL